MRLIEFFHVTEPDLLLEAAKDRYMQMLPDATIAKFFAALEVEPRLKDVDFLMQELNIHQMDLIAWLPKDIKMGWEEEVKWAMQALKKADRVVWYLRYVKVYLLREMHRTMDKQINAASLAINTYELDAPERKVQIPAVKQLRDAWQKLGGVAQREEKKLAMKIVETGRKMVEDARDQREEAYQAFMKADQEASQNRNTNTLSRRTNAERAFNSIDGRLRVIEGAMSRMAEEANYLTTPGSGSAIMNHKSALEHFMGIPAAGIHELEWGYIPWDMLRRIFRDEEQLWAAKQARVIKHDHSSWQGAEKIIEFDDGIAWWNLHRSSCDAEGKAMGHCGNSYRSQRPVEILSLREPEDEGWKVLLTFIWNTENGMIEESKAFDNQKPPEKYHPYILELLRQPFIKGFAQEGTHKPENNFHLADLDKETLEELEAENPGLTGAWTLQEFQNKYNVDEPLKQYDDGRAWYTGLREKGATDNNHMLLARPFQSTKGDTWFMRDIDIAYGNHGDIVNVSMAGDNTKPGPEYKDYIRDGLLLPGPAYYTSHVHERRDFMLWDFPEEEAKEIIHQKPTFIGGMSKEELQRGNYKPLIDYDDGSYWMFYKDQGMAGGMQDESDLGGEAIYGDMIKSASGEDYFRPALIAHFTGNRLDDLAMHPQHHAWIRGAEKKPLEAYHEVIMDLLHSDEIHTISKNHGGHNSFEISDIPQERWDAAVDAKPSLGGLAGLIKKEGLNDHTLAVINSKLRDLDIAGLHKLTMEMYDHKNNAFHVDSMAPHIFIDSYIHNEDGKSNVEWIYDYDQGDNVDAFDIYDPPDADSDDAINMLDALQKHDPEGYKKLMKYVWEEADDEDLAIEELENTSMMYKVIEDYAVDVRDAFNYAYARGLETGAANDAIDSLSDFFVNLHNRDVVDKYGDAPDTNVYFTVEPGDDAPSCGWCEGAKIHVWFGLDHIVDALDQEADYDTEEQLDIEVWKVEDISSPYYGWSGYDEEAAYDYFTDQIHEYIA